MSAIAELREAGLALPVDSDGPVFREPWEAHAFAMAVALHERGLFTWKEWAETLALAIRDAQAAGDADDGHTYYRHWLAALEAISIRKGLVDERTIANRQREWDEAARRTPHGRPIELARKR
jgi:nitrile hydratase accessory protein